MTYVKVKNTPFIRDINTMALLNTDRKAVSKDEAYKRELAKNKETEKEIKELKNEINDLKDMMKKLIEKVENSNG
jgi:cell division protein FtsB